MSSIRGTERTLENHHDTVLRGFMEINQLSRDLINEWRNGYQEILTKINANGATDFVTKVDFGIEKLAINILHQVDPDISVFGEEGFKHDFSLTTQPKYFVIDPVDGTKEFVRGGRDWSISLCLVENGEPAVASIFMPDRNLLFTAVKNRGCRLNGVLLNTGRSIRTTIAVSPRQIAETVFELAVASSGLEPVAISALTPKICALLNGEVDAAVYFPQDGQSAALWDYAAAVLLVREAGGKMSSLCGNELPFSGKEVIHKKGWLATKTSEVHTKLVSSLKI